MSLRNAGARGSVCFAAGVYMFLPGGASGGCVSSLPPAALTGFMHRPRGALDDPGGRSLVYAVREAGKDRRTHEALLSIMSGGRASDRQDIGRGLAMAYVGCIGQKPDVARAILALVQRTSDPRTRSGFRLGLEASRSDASGPDIAGGGQRPEATSAVFNIGIDHSLGARGLKLFNPFDPPLR